MREPRELARVESTHLGFEDHGVYTVNVNFSGAGWGQGTGHYAVSQNVEGEGQHAVNGWGMEFVIRMLQACGRERWEDLCGAVVWVLRDDHGKIIGVAPLEINEGTAVLFSEIDALVPCNL